MKAKVQISFDVEEFDMPLECGHQIDPTRQLSVGRDGLERIMPLLSAQDVRTTLFTTAHFAESYPNEIRSLAVRHEIASHTWFHTRYEKSHLQDSRRRLSEISGSEVIGLRMPRMRQVPMSDISTAGYLYDASLHPTWLPGRYNNLNKPRTIHRSEGVLRIPASVSPVLRIPLFWLAFKNYPYGLFLHLCRRVLRSDGYLSLYFHPWEFTDLRGFDLPKFTMRGSDGRLLERILRLVDELRHEAEFVTMRDLVQL